MIRYYAFFMMLFFLASPARSQDAKPYQQPLMGTYDPTANPEQQLRFAITEATETHKRIILEVGGEWCIWCHRLDTLFMKNPDITQFLKDNFILVKINFSKENDNEAFLKQYPKIPGYPHLFVLESDGSFLHSQDTGKLEKGKGHDRDKMMEFLTEWKKPK